MLAERTHTAIECTGVDFRDLSIDILERGYTLRFRARGGSMYPWIHDGDILTVVPRNQVDIRLGDVVFFQKPVGRVVVHRVVAEEVRDGVNHFLAKGDRLSKPDGWIPSTQTLGKVIAVERQGRRMDLTKGLLRRAQDLWFRLEPASNYCYLILSCVRRSMRRVWFPVKAWGDRFVYDC